jgi:hypothetical protein
VFAVLLAALIAPRGARAEDTDPRVVEAKTACMAGDVPKGVRLLAELYAATNDPIWIFNQGRCYQQNGEAQAALNRFREYLRKTAAIKKDEVSTSREAEAYIRELEIDLRRSTAPPTPRLEGASSDPGPEVRPSGEPKLRTAAITSAVVGGAGLASGLVFTLLTQRADARIRRLTDGEGPIERSQTLEIASANRDGRRYGMLQWIGYGVGASALVASGVLYLMGRPDSVEVKPARLAIVPAPALDGACGLLRFGL